MFPDVKEKREKKLVNRLGEIIHLVRDGELFIVHWYAGGEHNKCITHKRDFAEYMYNCLAARGRKREDITRH